MNVSTDPLADLVIDGIRSIRDAMSALTNSGREVVLVHDSEQRIIGLLTDGDIRRALLSGLTLDSPISEAMTHDFFFVSSAVDRASVLDLMKARQFRHVPVLDERRRLVAFHFLRDLIGATPKPNSAVIMAGGKGTRLWPVTKTVPKPMVEVAGRPLLERNIHHLVGHGIRTIYLAVNYMPEVIKTHFGDGSSFGCQIEYLHESSPLGTGGALSLLPFVPNYPLLVLNADQVTSIDISAMLEKHAETGCVATIAVGPHQVKIPFATVAEEGGRLVAIEEKPTINLLVNRGIYVLDPGALEHVPKQQEFPITALFESLMKANKHVAVFYFDDYWIDVGGPEDLSRARGLS